MKIDFAKLIVLLLPNSLRQTKLAFFVEACVEPLRTMYEDFLLWGEQKKLELATTWQVIQLESYLNKVLVGSAIRRDIFITDGDGFTSDFIINISSGISIDETRLKSIVDKYKLLGKRYIITGSARSYQFRWLNHVEEVVNAGKTFRWLNHVEEVVSIKIGVCVKCIVTPQYNLSGYISTITFEYLLFDVFGNPFTAVTDVYVKLWCQFSQGGEGLYFSALIRAGNNQKITIERPNELLVSEIYLVDLVEKNPIEDAQHSYIYEIYYNF